MKRSLISFLLLIMTWASYAQLDQKTLDQTVKTFVQTHPVKGMVYGLWINGKPININAHGETMTAVPVTKDMHFRVGGPTEIFLTTLLMQMVENKTVTLDDKIDRWFPKFPHAKEVSLKMLANGTSGYPDFVYNPKFVDFAVAHPFSHFSNEDLYHWAFMQKPLFNPGTSQHYSHTDYVILGNILEKISHQPMNELMQAKIFKPLGMSHTKFDTKASIPCPVLHSFSTQRNIYEESTFWDPSWTGSSGATTSTINDLGQWGNAFMSSRLISKTSTLQLKAPETVGLGKNNKNLYFAMGFGVANHWLIQNPMFGGYSGVFAVLPEKNVVFIAYNTLKEGAKGTSNLSVALFVQLAKELAPEFPLPPMPT